MKTSPGLAFLRSAVAVRRDLDTTRAVERQAEARRRDLPFPDAINPDALVAEGRLVDISVLAKHALDRNSTVRGFSVGLYASPAAGQSIERLGVEVSVVVAAAWWCCRRMGMESGLPRTALDYRPLPFLVNGPGDGEGWYCYQASRRADGSIYGVIFARGETNPAVPEGTSDRKEKASE